MGLVVHVDDRDNTTVSCCNAVPFNMDHIHTQKKQILRFVRLTTVMKLETSHSPDVFAGQLQKHGALTPFHKSHLCAAFICRKECPLHGSACFDCDSLNGDRFVKLEGNLLGMSRVSPYFIIAS